MGFLLLPTTAVTGGRPAGPTRATAELDHRQPLLQAEGGGKWAQRPAGVWGAARVWKCTCRGSRLWLRLGEATGSFPEQNLWSLYCLYGCLTNYHSFDDFKKHVFVTHVRLWGPESRHGLPGASAQGSGRVRSGCRLPSKAWAPF